MSALDIDGIVRQAEKVSGWMLESELRWLAEQAGRRHKIVEIGSWQGRSTLALALATPGTVWAIDDFRGEADRPMTRNELRRAFSDNLWPQLMKGKVLLLERPSLDAAALFRAHHWRFGMCFVDGSHSRQAVIDDVQHWLPLMESGGLLCGHDFGVGEVADALADVLPNAQVAVDTIWYWRAP